MDDEAPSSLPFKLPAVSVSETLPIALAVLGAVLAIYLYTDNKKLRANNEQLWRMAYPETPFKKKPCGCGESLIDEVALASRFEKERKDDERNATTGVGSNPGSESVSE